MNDVIYNSSIIGQYNATFNTNIQQVEKVSGAKIVYTLQCYKKDVVINRLAVNMKSSTKRNNGGIRGEIRELSEKSRNRLIFTLRNSSGLSNLIVLTYPDCFPKDGAIIRRHLTAFRKYLVRKGLSGVWIKEFQQRNAIHINFLVNGMIAHDILKLKWFDIVGSGDLAHAEHGVRIEEIRDFDKTASYVAKRTTKKVPEGIVNIGRFWGVFGNLNMVPEAELRSSSGEIIPIFVDCLEAENKQREQAGLQRREYNGIYSYISYGTAPILQQHLALLTRNDPYSCRKASGNILSFTHINIPAIVVLLWLIMAHYMIRNTQVWQRWRNCLFPDNPCCCDNCSCES